MTLKSNVRLGGEGDQSPHHDDIHFSLNFAFAIQVNELFFGEKNCSKEDYEPKIVCYNLLKLKVNMCFDTTTNKFVEKKVKMRFMEVFV